MKYFLLGLMLFCIGMQNVQAQTFQLPKYAYPFGYDSTINEMYHERMDIMVGQKMVVLPLCSENTTAGYPFFFRKPPEFSDFTFEDNQVKVINPASVYESDRDNPFFTPRKFLENKTFLIVGIDRVYSKRDEMDYIDLWILEGEDKTRLYYGFPPVTHGANDNVISPFVIYGFYEKLNAKWKNRTVASTKESHYNDIETGLPVKIDKAEEFIVEKILLSPLMPCAYVNIGFLLRSKDKKKSVFIDLTDLDVEQRTRTYDKPNMMTFIPVDLQTSLNIDKALWAKIFTVGITNDMSRELVRALLGPPDDITMGYTSSKTPGEQWSYGLYYEIIFSNGKIISAK